MASRTLEQKRVVARQGGSFNGFQVYGDNLDECFFFCENMREYAKHFGVDFLECWGPVDRPVFKFRHGKTEFGLLPCGRYSDWKDNRRPYIGYEDPDVILCHMTEPQKLGNAILGIEFNDAIEAGNNAWQRFPRIAQAAEKGIPFIYQVPICDAEVKDGEIRSTRHPNVIIQIAQMILMARFRSISLTVFGTSPWYETCVRNGTASKQVSGQKGNKNLAGFAVSTILQRISKSDEWVKIMRTSFESSMREMLYQISTFVERDFTILKTHPAFSEENFDEVISAWWDYLINQTPIPNKFRFFDWKKEQFLSMPQPFSKATSTKSKYKSLISEKVCLGRSKKKQELLKNLKEWHPITKLGPSRSILEKILKEGDIPLSYKKGVNEIAFIFNPKPLAKILGETYPSLDPTILNRISTARAIVFLPIAGYVMDSGGPAFSRPDKGFIGLMNVVFPKSNLFDEIVVLLFSELVPKNWYKQLAEASKEIKKGGISTHTNNLWREIARYATIVIQDIHAEGGVV